jgi:hypothetical protein
MAQVPTHNLEPGMHPTDTLNSSRGLGAVGASLVFGLVRGAGAFAVVLPSVVLVSRIQLGLGVSGATIVSGSCAHPSLS